jgi:hypothetical protein
MLYDKFPARPPYHFCTSQHGRDESCCDISFTRLAIGHYSIISQTCQVHSRYVRGWPREIREVLLCLCLCSSSFKLTHRRDGFNVALDGTNGLEVSHSSADTGCLWLAFNDDRSTLVHVIVSLPISLCYWFWLSLHLSVSCY